MDTRQCVIWIIILYFFMLGIVGCAMTPEKSSKAQFRISKEELKDRLDDQNLIILDVRRPQDWKRSGIKIKGAILENPYKFESWHSRYPKTKEIILY